MSARSAALVLAATIAFGFAGSSYANDGVAQVAESEQRASPDGSNRSKLPKFVTSCDAPRELVRLSTPLTATARALAQGRPINIVALGSSSTAGSGASSPQASYPARLEAELHRRFPGRDIQVLNHGTGGALAKDMLEKIQSTILELKPQLVIWQTGVNDATQDVGIEAFREVLDTGINLLRKAGIDVILVDQQFFPRSERVANFRDYLRAMRTAAEAHSVGLFNRYAIMRHMVKSGQHSPEQLLAPDNFHLNDLSYGCLADLMADGIEEQISPPRVDASIRPRR